MMVFHDTKLVGLAIYACTSKHICLQNAKPCPVRHLVECLIQGSSNVLLFNMVWVCQFEKVMWLLVISTCPFHSCVRVWSTIYLCLSYFYFILFLLSKDNFVLKNKEKYIPSKGAEPPNGIQWSSTRKLSLEISSLKTSWCELSCWITERKVCP